MQDFQLRVIEEKEQLFEKINKLHKAVYSENSLLGKIDDEDYVLLQKQLVKMTEYYIILQQRVAKF